MDFGLFQAADRSLPDRSLCTESKLLNNERWVLKKEVSLGDVLAVLVALCSVILAYAKLDSRITVLEELKVDLNSRLDRIENKLDRVIEKK